MEETPKSINNAKELKKLIELKDKNYKTKDKNKWKVSENLITKLPIDDRRLMLGVLKPKAFDMSNMSINEVGDPLADYVQEVDWRISDHVSPIKNQRTCGSCVSFATCAVMESMILIEKNEMMNVSEADLFFCSTHGANCDGWWAAAAFDSVRLRGICDENCNPYVNFVDSGFVPSCNPCVDRDKRTIKATKFASLMLNSDVKNYISTVGPVACAFDVYTDFFYYSSGIYRQVAGVYEGSHAVAIVGYSDIDKCWICKNSWGTTWGEDGYFSIGYGECLIDVYGKNGMSGIIMPNEPLPPPPLTESLEVNTSLFKVSQNSGKSKAIVTSNEHWTATSNMAWCTVSPTSGTSNGILTIVYNANKGNARTANIILKGKVINILIQVIQAKYVRPKF